MPNEATKTDYTETLSDKIKDFYKRWDITLNEGEIFEDFKRRTLHALLTMEELDARSIFKDPEVQKEFLQVIGELPNELLLEDIPWIGNYESNPTFQLLKNQQNFVKYIFYLQAIFWLKSLVKPDKRKTYLKLRNAITCSQVQINLVETENDYLFYPAGAKFLDQRLVNDVLNWIQKYPDVYENFKNALEKYNQRIYQRNLIDNLRLAFELLVKHVLGNNKSLENQAKAELGRYLKDKGISGEVRNLYVTLVKYYTDYQNKHVKHNDNINETEIELILYLTGTFMRFLLITESV
jgi:hypothetical protein